MANRYDFSNLFPFPKLWNREKEKNVVFLLFVKMTMHFEERSNT